MFTYEEEIGCVVSMLLAEVRVHEMQLSVIKTYPTLLFCDELASETLIICDFYTFY